MALSAEQKQINKAASQLGHAAHKARRKKYVYNDLAALVMAGGRPIVTFKKEVSEFEGYAEAGMRARLIRAVDMNDETICLTVDYAEFDEFNKQFETFNYFDRESKSYCLNARDAGHYKLQEDYFVTPSFEVKEMEVEKTERIALFGQFKALNLNVSYVQWLEDQLVSTNNVKKE